VLLAAAAIDWDTTLLPDDLTLPLLWAGLIAAARGWTIPLTDALWGGRRRLSLALERVLALQARDGQGGHGATATSNSWPRSAPGSGSP
jgi:prepilin signal peptidase PulO-like enzyme (type II secretory pathway)